MALKNSVSFQEYDQTLRDAVNAYYEHAMNDPSMSREEAVQSTAQMSEQYLNATEEFQANMESETQAVNTGNEISAGNDGLEGSEEGGIDSDDGGIE